LHSPEGGTLLAAVLTEAVISLLFDRGHHCIDRRSSGHCSFICIRQRAALLAAALANKNNKIKIKMQFYFYSPEGTTLLVAAVVNTAALFAFAKGRHFIGRCINKRCNFIFIRQSAPLYWSLQ